MVIGGPHVIEASLLSGDRNRDGGFQHGGVVLGTARRAECPEIPRASTFGDVSQQSRSPGL